MQFVDKKFRVDHDATVGVEFGAKTISSKTKNVKLQIWDTVNKLKLKNFQHVFSIRPVRNHLNQLQDLIIEGNKLLVYFNNYKKNEK